MKRTILACLILLLIAPHVSAQRPNRQLFPLRAYNLQGYVPVPFEEAFALPASMETASYAGVAMNARGNLVILSRGNPTFLEFETDGTFVRAFGADGLLARSHGMHIDRQDNIWVTDVRDHVVMKLDSNGNVLMTLGSKGQSGEWDEAAGMRLFSEPNDVALDSAGNIYVAQGHGGDLPRVIKFSPDGEYITQWGSRGYGPGQYVAAHSIDIDRNDVIYVADRENMRIQRYDTEGTMLRTWEFDAMVCAIYWHDDGHLYMTTGFDGEMAKVDSVGKVIGAIGSPGEGNGQFGEAHHLTVDAEKNVYVSDVILRRIQKFENLQW